MLSPLPAFSPANSAPKLADAIRLFELILPREGYRAAAIGWRKRGDSKEHKRNQFFDSDEAMAATLVREGARHNVWHSTATFRKRGTRHDGKDFRGKTNVLARQCLHADIDCGEGKPYASSEAGQAALTGACGVLGLPSPVVVCSGHGLHAYWPLNVPVADMELWQAHATGIRTALESAGLGFDSQCSIDEVRILRTPGTLNHKSAPLPVFVEDWGDGPQSLATFSRYKDHGQCQHRAQRQNKRRRKTVVELLGPPPDWLLMSPERDEMVSDVIMADAVRVFSHCAQMRNMFEARGNIPEPHWYACIGVLPWVENGAELAHEVSCGHPTYSHDETQERFDRSSRLSGPSTCKRFRNLGNGLCRTCLHRVHSPADLGRGEL
jgi:hypothetical protein